MNENFMKHAGDVSAVIVTVGTLSKMLPSIAALFTIVWTAIRIYETATFQNLMKRVRRK